MRLLPSPLAALVLLVVPPIARGEQPTPRSGPPEFRLASVTRSDGKIVVRVARLASMARETVDGKEVFIAKNHWVAEREFVLGEHVRAYRQDGRAAEPGDVLKALSEPRGVACFIGFIGPKPTPPDPFYLGLLREGSIVLSYEVPPDPPALGRP